MVISRRAEWKDELLPRAEWSSAFRAKGQGSGLKEVRRLTRLVMVTSVAMLALRGSELKFPQRNSTSSISQPDVE